MQTPRLFQSSVWLLALLTLAACQPLSTPQVAAPPPPPEAVQSLPTVTPLQPPTSTPLPATPIPPSLAETGFAAAGTVAPGEIIFVRDGQLWAIGVDGGGERQLTTLDVGAVVRDLTLAPSGQHLAFTVDSVMLAVYDLWQGTIVVLDRAGPGGLIGEPVWSPDGKTMAYLKLATDPLTSQPLTTQVWQAGLDPAAAPHQVLDATLPEGRQVLPVAALAEGGLLLAAALPEAGSSVSLLLYAPGSDLAPVALGGLVESPLVWDASVDRTKLLLSDLSAESSGGPSELVVADFSSVGGLSNPVTVAADENFAFREARFAPDSRRVIALRSARSPESEGVSDLVLFVPSAGGAFSGLTLSPDPAYTVLAMSWHGEDGVVAQRYPIAGTVSELWLLPLDGSPGKLIAVGEQPVVAALGS